jgi:hypothetical protein
MARLKHTFLTDAPAEDTAKLGYLDGFRFGFGFFIAWLLGTVILAAVIGAATLLIHH